MSDLNGADGFALNGVDANDGTGHSVSAVGDVNADGIDDIIIGNGFAAPNGNAFAGTSYVVFGRQEVQIECNGLPVTVDLNLGQTPGPGDDVISGGQAADTDANCEVFLEYTATSSCEAVMNVA